MRFCLPVPAGRTAETVDDLWDDRQEAVTLTAGELDDRPATGESRGAGQKSGGHGPQKG